VDATGSVCGGLILRLVVAELPLAVAAEFAGFFPDGLWDPYTHPIIL
jgi:hypothetical protein